MAENQYLFDPQRLEAVRLTGLLDSEPDEAFDRLARVAQRSLATPYAFVHIVDETRSYFKSCIGLDRSQVPVRGLPIDHSFCQYVIATNDAVVAGDVLSNPLTRANPSIETQGVRAWAGFPLRSPNGQIVGTFCVVDTQVRSWTDAEIEILETLAFAASGEIALRDALHDAVTLAVELQLHIENSAIATAEHDADLRSVFSSIDEGFVVCEMIVDDNGGAVDYRILNVNPLFETMTGLVSPIGKRMQELLPDIEATWLEQFAKVALDGERLRFELGSQGRWYEVFATPLGMTRRFAVVFKDRTKRRASELASQLARSRAELVAKLLTDLESQLTTKAQLQCLVETLVPTMADHATIDGTDGDERLLVESANLGPEINDGWHSRIVTPLDLGIGAKATLRLSNWDADRDPFTPDDQNFLRDVAQRASVVLAAGRLRYFEHHAALRLQEALLPDTITWHPEVVIEARYQAASALLEVGGDWYDTFAWPNGCVGLMVGDVVGHTLESAAAMGRIRAATAALAGRVEAEPSLLLGALDHFARGRDGASFATAVCVIVDPADGKLSYSSAGHPPVIVVGADGRITRLDGAQSLAICALEAETRPQATMVLEPDALVIMYSDGLIERRGESIDAGLERLEQLAIAARHRPINEVADHLLAGMGEHSPAHDDIVVACFRYTPVLAEILFEIPAHGGNLAPMRAELRGWLQRQRVALGPADDLLLGVGEACSNAIEHAGREDGIGTVSVKITNHSSHVVANVADEGPWRTPNNRGQLRGRGTSIMQHVSLHFTRSTDRHGTKITMAVSHPIDAAAD